MNFRNWIESPRTRLDIVAGMVDGILNALTLAAGRLLKSGGGSSIDLALRVGIAAALTTLFVFFVAHYAELRAEIARAERQLNLMSHGSLAVSRLGRKAINEAAAGAALAAICGFAGASIPLLLAVVMPGPAWLGLGMTIMLLGMLGVILAKSVHGSSLFWGPIIMAGGMVLTLIGIRLDLVS